MRNVYDETETMMYFEPFGLWTNYGIFILRRHYKSLHHRKSARVVYTCTQCQAYINVYGWLLFKTDMSDNIYILGETSRINPHRLPGV